MHRQLRRIAHAGLGTMLASALLVVVSPGVASATLKVLQPNPAVAATFVGPGGYSADGLGQTEVGGTVQAEVPSGSTVVRAYLYGTYFSNTDPELADRTLDFDGTTVVLTTLPNSEPGGASLSTARVEVTAQVAAKVGSGGGITNFAVNTDPSGLDGVALVVIFSNPALPSATIAVLDGGSKQDGDTATLNFAAPLNVATPGFSAIMSLGSGFSSQGIDGHACGGTQFSTVNVNGARLASCAGNYDDGLGSNGALITVGGVGDSIDNPADPNAEFGGTDDELYNLAPLLHTGDTSMTITTTNPSTDDNLFLSVIKISAEATVTTEICGNAVDDDGDTLVDLADPDCASRITTKLSGGLQTGTSITVPSGTAVHDSAALTGNSVSTAGGTVTYQVFPDAGCATTATSAGTKTVTNGVVPDSDPLTLAVGTWHWKASYSGDATHTPASSCDEVATVTTDTPVNHLPVASDKSVSTSQDVAVGVTLTALDADGEPLTYTVVTGPAHGSLSGTAPNLTYTPTAGYTGPDSFTFKANDTHGDSNTATVSISVTAIAPTNHLPVANDQCVSTSQGVARNVTLTATDADNDALSYSVVSGPAHGTLSGTAPNLIYTPAAGYSGPDSFTFKANDTHGDSNIAIICICIAPASPAPPPPNRPPVADQQCITTPKGIAVPIVLTGSDPDGDPLTYAIVAGPSHGALSGPTPAVLYTPAPGFTGSDFFTFAVNDGHETSVAAHICISVTGPAYAVTCRHQGKDGHGNCKWWHVPKNHNRLKVQNKGQGWVAVTVWVNGHRLYFGKIQHGTRWRYNIARYMKGNGRDVVSVKAVGSTAASDITFGM